MNGRALLVLAAAGVAALVLTRPRPAPPAPNPQSVPGPYMTRRLSPLVLPVNRAVDPWRRGIIRPGG